MITGDKRREGVHTVPAPDGKRGWWNKVDGEFATRHKTKETAIAAGRELARVLRKEHSIHRTDGVITEKNSYGNDPCPPKDGE